MADESKAAPLGSNNLGKCLSPELFKALADPTRVLILTHLAASGQELKVTEVSGCCPVDLSVVSRHLGVLKDAGILSAQKRGREVYYRVRTRNLTTVLRELADALEACCPETYRPERSEHDDPEQEA